MEMAHSRPSPCLSTSGASWQVAEPTAAAPASLARTSTVMSPLHVPGTQPAAPTQATGLQLPPLPPPATAPPARPNPGGRPTLPTLPLQVAAEQDIPFKKLMAANRGEIAVRITRAGIELGMTTVRQGGGSGGWGCWGQSLRGTPAAAAGSWLPCLWRCCTHISCPCLLAHATGCLQLSRLVYHSLPNRGCTGVSVCWRLLLAPPLLALRPVTLPSSPTRMCRRPAPQLAIYSEADRLQPHRFKADESYQVGGLP